MKIVQKFCALFLSVSLLACTGCSAVQVRDRTYLQALELKQEDELIVQLHDFQEPVAIAESTGESVENALAKSAVVTGKELFLGHLELIAYADPSFSAQLDAWMTQYRLSPSCQVLGLAAGETLEDQDTALMVEQLQYAQENGLMPKTNLYTILREFAGSSETALMPFLSNGGFSAAVITKNNFCGSLSADAVAGLCWLRDDSYPNEIALSNGENYFLTSASTRLSAEVRDNHIAVTIFIRIQGDGEFSKAADVIQIQCKAAIQETVIERHADVFDLEACLKSQCYHYIVDKGWEEAISNATFTIEIKQAS